MPLLLFALREGKGGGRPPEERAEKKMRGESKGNLEKFRKIEKNACNLR